MTTSGWSNSTGWPSLTSSFLTIPPSGAVIGFMTFIASTISRVSPALTASPGSTNALASGCGDKNAVPTMGDLMVVPATSSGGASAAGAAATGAAAGATGAGAGAPATGAGSRLTLIRRSPSATSISVSALSV